MVYDVTNADSFVHVKNWLHEIEQNCDVVSRILGNTYDHATTVCGEYWRRKFLVNELTFMNW